MTSPVRFSYLPIGSGAKRQGLSRGPDLRLPVSVALALAILAYPVSGFATDMEVPTVSVIAAREQKIERTVSVVGTIVPKETTLVNVDLEGAKIDTIMAEEGDLVVRGQILATLDSSKINVELLQNDAQKDSAIAQRGQAASALDNAVITRDEAKADLQRGEKLVSKGLLSQEMLEQRQSVLARAEAAVNSAKQAIKVAEAAVETIAASRKDIELRLSYTRIVAPTAGRILTRSAKAGAIASASGGQLFMIANDDLFELETEIPQSQYSNIAVGAMADISAGDGAPSLKGVVRLIAPSLADSTRLGRARITLPHTGRMPVGAFASARIDIGGNSGIFLPSSAITDIGDEPSVKILKDNRIEQKAVSLGVRQAGLVQVQSGIDEGDLVVLKSGSFMDIGDRAIPFTVQADASIKAAIDADGN